MRRALIIFFAIIFINSIEAQLKLDLQPDLGKFFASGVDDAEELLKAYIGPYANAFGATMTGGWYHTAKVHKPLGVDLSASFNVAVVPVEDRSFDIQDLTLQSLAVASGEGTVAPSAPGDRDVGPQMVYDFPDPIPQTNAFEMPKGTGAPFFGSPMLQLGLGLIKGTDVIVRYMPTISPGNTEFNMWGVGFKHSIKQWIPVIEKVPVLHLTLQGGYTKFGANFGINVTPDLIGADGFTGANSSSWENQEFNATVKSLTGNILISANLPVICFYGGLGFARTVTDIAINGDFPIVSPSTDIMNPGMVVTAVTDPLSMTIRNADGNATKPRMNIGLRIKLGPVFFFGDYTRANYNVYTGGLGLTFR